MRLRELAPTPHCPKSVSTLLPRVWNLPPRVQTRAWREVGRSRGAHPLLSAPRGLTLARALMPIRSTKLTPLMSRMRVWKVTKGGTLASASLGSLGD